MTVPTNSVMSKVVSKHEAHSLTGRKGGMVFVLECGHAVTSSRSRAFTVLPGGGRREKKTMVCDVCTVAQKALTQKTSTKGDIRDELIAELRTRIELLEQGRRPLTLVKPPPREPRATKDNTPKPPADTIRKCTKPGCGTEGFVAETFGWVWRPTKKGGKWVAQSHCRKCRIENLKKYNAKKAAS